MNPHKKNDTYWSKIFWQCFDIVSSGPVFGALYMLILTWLAFRHDDTRFMGFRATFVLDLTYKHFANDLQGLTWALAAIAIGFGGLIGIFAEVWSFLKTHLRETPTSWFRRCVERWLCVVFLHAWCLACAAAYTPQLYTDSFYNRQNGAGWLRTLQIIVTDVLGFKGVIVVGCMAFLLSFSFQLRQLFSFLKQTLRSLRTVHFVTFVACVFIGLVWVFTPSFQMRRQAHARRHRAGLPNIVILAADSLRDDRVNAQLAPHLHQLASSGVRFSQAYVTLPRTLPSWTSILTGRDPHRHGIRTMFPRYEDRARDLAALPARLHSLGYKSAVVGDFAADIFTRVRYGFDIVDTPTFNFHTLITTRALERAIPLLPILHTSIGRTLMPPMRELNQAADPHRLVQETLHTLDRIDDGKAPIFLTLFFSTPHFPYAAPEPFYRKYTNPSYRGRFKYHKPNLLGQEDPLDASDIQQVRGLYDGSINAVDDAVGTLLKALEARGLQENTIVVVTADHGEMLYEANHGQGHGDHLFGDQVVHVPLAIKVPTQFSNIVQPHQENTLVRDVDLAPTLLDLIGVQANNPSEFDGRSLRPLLEGKRLPSQPAFAETEIWMSENIPEVPSTGASPFRLPYPNVALLTELDPRLHHDIVMRAEIEPLVIAAKHRMILHDHYKLIYAPTRKGARYWLFDRRSDPDEMIDLAASKPKEVTRLKAILWRWMLNDLTMEERDGLLTPKGRNLLQNKASEPIDTVRIQN